MKVFSGEYTIVILKVVVYREQNVSHVLLHSSDVFHGVRRFVNTGTFTGQDSLINAEAAGRKGEKPAVGRDFVANGDRDDIAWNELGRVDATKLT